MATTRVKKAKAIKSDITTPPGSAEPTWGKSTVAIQIKGSGMKAQKATRIHVVLPDGSIGSRKAGDEIAVWPTLRLRMVFGRGASWRGNAGAEQREKAIRAVIKLAAIAGCSWINSDVIGRVDVPVLKPVSFTSTELQRLVARTLFVEQKATGTAWIVARTGGALDVRYDASVVVLDDSVQLHLPQNAESAALLEATLDALVGEVPFAWASVGYGLGGWSSARALSMNELTVRSIKGVTLKTIEQRAPGAGADWLVWTGALLRGTPAHDAITDALGRDESRTTSRHGALVRIAVPRPASPDDVESAISASRLAVDLDNALKKLHALDFRAALRRLTPGKKPAR